MNEPQEYAVVDVETTMIADGEYPRTLFWGYADSKGYHRFETTKKLLAFLKKEPAKTLLHHSNFDVLQLLLDGAQVQIQRSHNARLIRCKLGNHTLLNSYSVFPVSLGKIFSCFGFEKTSLDNLDKRNFEDCVNGLKCFLELDSIFERLCKVSPLKKGTIAGTSFAAAQLQAGKMPADDRFLEAYRGGRVEVFNTTEATCDKFDINSSYPFSILETPEQDRLLRLRVKTEDFYCPFFDADSDDMLCFPNGTFETWIYESNLERYILPHAKKTKIKIVERHKIDFSWLCACKSLVATLYRTKQESSRSGQKAIAEAAKLLLNSFYGRIGLKGEAERARFLDYMPDVDDGTIYKLGKRWLVFDTVYREVKSNFPFAAWITDNARARLFRAFVGSEAFYGDTDSVMTPHGKNYFDKSERMGDDCGSWKHEGRDKFKANNVKDYFWGEDEVRKGGDGFIEWTLKRLASNRPPAEIKRERISELRKRLVSDGGVTLPLTVIR